MNAAADNTWQYIAVAIILAAVIAIIIYRVIRNARRRRRCPHPPGQPPACAGCPLSDTCIHP